MEPKIIDYYNETPHGINVILIMVYKIYKNFKCS